MMRGQQAQIEYWLAANLGPVFLSFGEFPSVFVNKHELFFSGGGRYFADLKVGPRLQEIIPVLSALTYDAERNLDPPNMKPFGQCSWLSTVLVGGSDRRERGGDRCSQLGFRSSVKKNNFSECLAPN